MTIMVTVTMTMTMTIMMTMMMKMVMTVVMSMVMTMMIAMTFSVHAKLIFMPQYQYLEGVSVKPNADPKGQSYLEPTEIQLLICESIFL